MQKNRRKRLELNMPEHTILRIEEHSAIEKAMRPYPRRPCIIMAHKYSCREGHIYPVGIYSTPESVTRCVHRVMYGRSGRYGVKVYVQLHSPIVDDDKNLKLIYEIESPYKNKAKS